MTVRSLRAASLLFALASLLLPATHAVADEYEVVELDRDVARASAYRLHARVLGTSAGSRPGGRGYVHIELVNPHDVGHVVRVRVEPMNGGENGEFSAHKTVRVEPGSRTVFDVPLGNTSWMSSVSFVVDDRSVDESVSVLASARGSRRMLSALGVGPGVDASWGTYLQAEASKRSSRRSGADVQDRTASELPGSWTMLSGFDLIIVDGAASELTAERQEVLLRYVAGGGNLIAFGLGSLVSGPLLELKRSSASPKGGWAKGFHGLGRWLVFEGPANADSDVVREWIEV